ncbi:MAG: DNA recombination protein RmuC, partial [Mariprofundus sp.]|nr:DNA recombination protein RmuC [Mariprofundus sp.]
MIELVLIGVIALILVLWFMHARNQKKEMSELHASMQSLTCEIETQKLQIASCNEELTVQKVSNASLGEKVQQAEKQQAELKQELAAKEAAMDAVRRELSDDKSSITELQTRIAEERKAAVEKLALLEEAKEKLGNEFKVLANQIFEEKGKAFSAQNRSSLDEVLKPMREQLGDFRKRVDEIHTDDTRERASLKAHLGQLKDLNQQMSADALNLTQALKGESKTQGNWGEMILERILESSGLREGEEFAREQS